MMMMIRDSTTLVKSLAMLVLLSACSGEEPIDTSEGRTPCEQQCWDQEIPACSQTCQRDCAEQTGEEFARCTDACQGNTCLPRYDDCVSEECT